MAIERAEESYGQRPLTLVDRFGVWLSQRPIRNGLPRHGKLRVLDIGCGYNATHLVSLSERLKHGVGIDFKIDERLKNNSLYTFIESPIEEAVAGLPNETADVILMISVLEHLEQPVEILKQCHRILAKGGRLLVNVPTWLGKGFLEFSAFRLGLSPATEMDDHKMYYDKKDLWPLLIQAGFKPSGVRMNYHKFNLNLFAYITKR